MQANDSYKGETSYAPLLESIDVEKTDQDGFEKVQPSSQSAKNKKRTYTFTLGSLAFYFITQAVVTIVLTAGILGYARNSNQDNEVAMKTGEFAPARDYVVAEKVLFVASTNFNKSREPPQSFRNDVPIYIGHPSKEVDNAWAKLLDDQYFYISDEEARSAWGPGYQEYYREDGRGYRAGLDVFHTLHCLNIIRKEIYWEYYRGRPLEGYMARLQAYHIDHCIDVIRQSLQCSSDLTPIPVRWYDNATGKSAIDSERIHTCRNNAKIREWTTKQVQRT